MPDQLFVGGEWRDASDGRTIDVFDPATEQVVATVPDASDADLDAVLAAAASGFDTWRRASPTQRSEVLARAASLPLERTEEIAAVLTQEQGKPLDEARAEVRQSAEQFGWFPARPCAPTGGCSPPSRAGRGSSGDRSARWPRSRPGTHARRRAAVAELVEKAAAVGATVRCGGRAPDGPGFFFLPTVLTDVPADAAVLRDEPFGPVLSVLRFGTLDEGLAQANDVPYGLAAYVYTADLGRADVAGAGLDVGMIGVNETAVASAASPFGGVGLSGYGREGGTESIEAYTVTTAVTSRGRP